MVKRDVMENHFFVAIEIFAFNFVNGKRGFEEKMFSY